MNKKGNHSMFIKANYKGFKFKCNFDGLNEYILTEMFSSLQNTYDKKIPEKIIKILDEYFGL
jgi:hypothetical protein